MLTEPPSTRAGMQPAAIPLDESDRLKALNDLNILDSSPSESYDRITRFVSRALNMPTLVVSLVDAHRQWFKSRVGLDATETPREVSFCAHAVADCKPLIVPDATQDKRFAGNPLVTGAPHIRAYMGVPLLTRKGYAIGTLCVIDTHRARTFNEEDLNQLIGYAKIIEEFIHAQELARADQALLLAEEMKSREINQRLRQIADNMPARIAYWDRAGICRFANQAHFSRFALTSQQLVGMSIKDLLGASLFEQNRVYIEAALRGERQLYEHTAVMTDGTVRYFCSEHIPDYRDEQIVGFYSQTLDITDRKLAEQVLAKREAELTTVGRMAEIGGWELHRGAAGPQWSEIVYRIHEVPLGQAPSLRASLEFYPPESRGMVEETLQAAFEDGQPFDFVTPLITASGRHRWVRSIGEPQVVSGQVTSIIGALQDVTLQKQLETELAQAQKLESIGQLSAGIAHEINTPTQFIGNNIGFLKESMTEVFGLLALISRTVESSRDGTVDAATLTGALQNVDLRYLRDEVPKAIDQSLDGVERIQKIVSAMKEFSHPAVEKTLLDLNRAINSTIVVASNEWKYVADVKTDFDADLPPVTVMPGSFNQVILNMIVNAAHALSEAAESTRSNARPKGTITVTTRRVDRWAEIRVQDTGCGIPEKIRDRIFDPFFTTKPVGKGTGQGLAIAHDVIVNKHGGVILVESELGVGTTFILRLPLLENSAGAIAAA